VAIGVASVILLTSLGEGARLFVMGEFASLGSNLAIVIPGKTETTGAAPFISTSPNDLTVEDTEALVRRIPRVRRAAPIAIGGAAVRAGDRSREVPVIGTTGEFLDIRNLTMAVGRFLPAGEAGEESRACVIGSMVQSELFEGRNPLGKTLRIGEYRFRVVGVLGSRGESIGMNVDDMVYIPVETAMRMFNTTSLFRIIAEVNAYSEMDLAKREILAVLRERHGGEEDVTVFTQDSVLSSFGNILRMLTAALAGIAAVSLAVAGIGIMNVMLVTVVERTREIGLLKALGVGRGQILSVFLVESALISLSGGVAGVGAALGITAVARHAFPEFPVQAPVWAVAAALGVSILVGVLFGAMPARRAARLDPIAALARR
jgi:putative ABC transport system permease protein